MNARAWIFPAALVLSPIAVGACDRPDEGGEAAGSEVEIDEELGTLTVRNEASEPVAVFMDGQELYAVPPGRAYTFRNLPTRKVTVYGVGRISEKHYGLPELTIERGGEYEWTIRP